MKKALETGRHRPALDREKIGATLYRRSAISVENSSNVGVANSPDCHLPQLRVTVDSAFHR
jgi:hypothetical protein